MKTILTIQLIDLAVKTAHHVGLLIHTLGHLIK